MRQEEARTDQVRASGAALSSLTIGDYTPPEPLPLSVLMMCRSLYAFTFELADQMDRSELLEQREASAAALARLIGAGDALAYEIAYLAAQVEAFDAAVAERAWQSFTRQNGGRDVA